MDRLPLHLVYEILFRLDLKSLAMMQCTGRSLRSHISNDPYFKSEYFSRVGSGLFHISTFGSKSLSSYPFGNTRSLLRNKGPLEMKCRILGSCSGLLLLYVSGLCVTNPLTKRFRFLDHSESLLVPEIVSPSGVGWNRIGFAVHQIDGTTQRFKIVCIHQASNHLDENMYRFEINAGDTSWRLSESTITCGASDLMMSIKPVYFDGALHWLRNDGSIVAFNPETEQARVIQIKFPENKSSKTALLTDKRLTLITATEEVIHVYALEKILTDPKWVLVKRIGNGVLDKKELVDWKVVAYDEKGLVLYEKKNKSEGVVHRYDLRGNKWGVMGLIPKWCDTAQDFYQFKPSPSSVLQLDDEKMACHDHKRFSSLSTIMRLIGGNSPCFLNLLKKKNTLIGKQDGRAENQQKNFK